MAFVAYHWVDPKLRLNRTTERSGNVGRASRLEALFPPPFDSEYVRPRGTKHEVLQSSLGLKHLDLNMFNTLELLVLITQLARSQLQTKCMSVEWPAFIPTVEVVQHAQ